MPLPAMEVKATKDVGMLVMDFSRLMSSNIVWVGDIANHMPDCLCNQGRGQEGVVVGPVSEEGARISKVYTMS